MFASIASWDTAVEYFVVAHRAPVLTDIFLFLTSLGNVFVITVVAISIALVLFRDRLWHYKIGFAVALFGALLASEVIKLIIARARPPEMLWLIQTGGYSFPSMHAAVSMATYGFLAYMSWKLLHPPHHRLPWVVFLSILIILIGFSRVYLGVHYVSDVLAGFAVGALCLYAGVLATKFFRRAASKAKPSAPRRRSRLA